MKPFFWWGYLAHQNKTVGRLIESKTRFKNNLILYLIHDRTLCIVAWFIPKFFFQNWIYHLQKILDLLWSIITTWADKAWISDIIVLICKSNTQVIPLPFSIVFFISSQSYPMFLTFKTNQYCTADCRYWSETWQSSNKNKWCPK